MSKLTSSITVENKDLPLQLSTERPAHDVTFFKGTVAVRAGRETLCTFNTVHKCPFPVLTLLTNNYTTKARVISIDPHKVKVGVVGGESDTALLYVAIYNAPDQVGNYE